MNSLERNFVVEWFKKNYNTNKVLREFGEDPVYKAARIFKISYNAAKTCERLAAEQVEGTYRCLSV